MIYFTNFKEKQNSENRTTHKLTELRKRNISYCHVPRNTELINDTRFTNSAYQKVRII